MSLCSNSWARLFILLCLNVLSIHRDNQPIFEPYRRAVLNIPHGYMPPLSCWGLCGLVAALPNRRYSSFRSIACLPCVGSHALWSLPRILDGLMLFLLLPRSRAVFCWCYKIHIHNAPLRVSSRPVLLRLGGSRGQYAFCDQPA